MNTKAVVALTFAIVAVCVAALLFTNFLIHGKSGGLEKVPQEFLEIPESPSNQEQKKSEEKSGDGENKSSSTKKDFEDLEMVPEDEINPDSQNPVEVQLGKDEVQGENPIQSPISTTENVNQDFHVPPAKNGAKLCFVIDDGGSSVENLNRYASLPFPLTIAILPKLSHSSECAKIVVEKGKELILHQPMQAHDYSDGRTPNPGPGAILPEMDKNQVESTVNENLEEIGSGAKGLNNHEGSLITEDSEKMAAVLSVTQARKIYFLDSRTTSRSSVPDLTKETGIKYLGRFAPFLDNIVDREQMLEELYKGLAVANRDGYAIIIGHVDKSVEILPRLLSDIYPTLVKNGYVLTTPSQLD